MLNSWLLPQEEHIPNKHPLHSCGKESTSLVLCEQNLSLSISRFFMSLSDPFSLEWIFTRANSLSSTLSLNQWYLLFICLVREWYAPFLARRMELWLSRWSTNLSCFRSKFTEEIHHRNQFFPGLYHCHILYFCDWQGHRLMQSWLPWLKEGDLFLVDIPVSSLWYRRLGSSPCIGHHITWCASAWVYITRHFHIGKSFGHRLSDSEPKAYTFEVPFKYLVVHGPGKSKCENKIKYNR